MPVHLLGEPALPASSGASLASLLDPRPPSRPHGLALPRPSGSLDQSPLDPTWAPDTPSNKNKDLEGLDNNHKNNNSDLRCSSSHPPPRLSPFVNDLRAVGEVSVAAPPYR